MNRRDTVLALVALGATPITSVAQQKGKVWRIGLLHSSNATLAGPGLGIFRESLRQFGYLEGRDYVLEVRFADSDDERLSTLAAELVQSKPDVLMANVFRTTQALKMATSTIPIVMVSVGDPVGSGLVESLARPGGNVTGMSNSLTDIASKHLDVLHELLPHVSRLAVLIRLRYQSHQAALKLLQESAPRIGVHVLPIVAESAQEIRDGFAAMTQQKAQALVVVIDPLYFEQLSEIAELALKAKLPSIGYSSAFANAGFLVGYGPNSAEFYRQAAVYVDKILKGAKPRDLPVTQPTKFEFVINLKTAKILGVTIPQSALIRADQVIE